MSSLRERVEGLVAKLRTREIGLSKAIGLTPAALLNGIADELAAALVAEGQGEGVARLSLEEVRLALNSCPGYLGAFSNADFNFVTEFLNGLLISPEIRVAVCHCRDCMYHGAIFRQWEHMQKASETPMEMGNMSAAAPSLHKEGLLTEQQVSNAICYRQDDFTEHSTLDISETTHRLNAALRASPAGRAEQVSGSTGVAKRGEAT